MIDLSEGMLSRAKAKAANLQIGQKLDFVSGDVQDLPFRDSAFDTVTDTFSFCVFPSPQAAMNEMARVLKPGEQCSCIACMSVSAACLTYASCICKRQQCRTFLHDECRWPAAPPGTF